MILIGGENLIDLVQIETEDDFPQFKAIPGGSPYNVALAAARQGMEVHYLTPISSDSLGRLLAERLIEAGVKLAAPRNTNPTSLAVVSIDNGMPTYAFHRNGTAERMVSLEGLKSIQPTGGKVFQLGSLAITDGEDAAVWEEFFHHCKQSGIMTSLDPNIRPSLIPDRPTYMARLNRILKSVDVLKLSDEDLSWLIPDTPLEEAWDTLVRNSSACLAILTMGQKGAMGRVGNTRVTIPRFGLDKLVDTVGSGDTFMASILVWLAENNCFNVESLGNLDESSLIDCLERASKAAGLNCRQQGCQPPTREDLMNPPEWDTRNSNL